MPEAAVLISLLTLVVLREVLGWGIEYASTGPLSSIYVELASAAELALSPGAGLVAAVAVAVIEGVTERFAHPAEVTSELVGTEQVECIGGTVCRD